MTDGIIAGGEKALQAVEQLNESDFGPQPPFTWTVDLPNATIAPVPDVPGRAVLKVPADETATAALVTVSANDPDGKPISTEKSVPILPRVYSIKLSDI